METNKDQLCFKPLFRLLDMLPYTVEDYNGRIVAYTNKLIDCLKKEGYETDAKIVENVYLEMFKGKKVAFATMDKIKEN